MAQDAVPACASLCYETVIYTPPCSNSFSCVCKTPVLLYQFQSCVSIDCVDAVSLYQAAQYVDDHCAEVGVSLSWTASWAFPGSPTKATSAAESSTVIFVPTSSANPPTSQIEAAGTSTTIAPPSGSTTPSIPTIDTSLTPSPSATSSSSNSSPSQSSSSGSSSLSTGDIAGIASAIFGALAIVVTIWVAVWPDKFKAFFRLLCCGWLSCCFRRSHGTYEADGPQPLPAYPSSQYYGHTQPQQSSYSYPGMSHY